MNDLFVLNDWTENVFCPTGPGGGVDPTCSPKGGQGFPGATPFEQKMSRTVVAVYKSTTHPETKESLERVMANLGFDLDSLPDPGDVSLKRFKSNTDSGLDFQRDLARNLALAWEDTSPKGRPGLEPLMKSIGLDPLGKPGDVTSFDAGIHRTSRPQSILPGQNVRVVASGWSFSSKRGTMNLVKTEVEAQ